MKIRTRSVGLFLNHIQASPTMEIFITSFTRHGFESNDLGIRYVTCSSVLGKQWIFSFSGFFSAFDLNTWLFLLLCGSTTGICFLLFLEPKEVSDKFWHLIFSLIILLDQSFTLSFKRFKNKNGHIVPIYLTWILVGIILSCGYRGANIGKLISPIPDEIFETVDQAITHNLTFYARTSFLVYEILSKANLKRIQNESVGGLGLRGIDIIAREEYIYHLLSIMVTNRTHLEVDLLGRKESKWTWRSIKLLANQLKSAATFGKLFRFYGINYIVDKSIYKIIL